MKIKTATIEPLKMGRVKSTGKTRAIACRVTIEREDGSTSYHHVDTLKGGIIQAYQVAQQMIVQDMKERGVA